MSSHGVDALVKRHIDEREQKVLVIETLASTAEDEGRDLYATELETIDNARSRIKDLDIQIEKVSGDLEMADGVRNRVRALDPSALSRDYTYRSAGEYMWDYFHKHENSDAAGRFARFHKRAAEHMGLDKANTTAVAGGFTGLIVTPTGGAVLDPRPEGRPLFTALGVRQIGSTNFMRPRIIDPNFATGVAAQGLEKAELASKAWDIVADQVTATVYGGYINVSELLIEMLAGSLDMVISHMNRRLEALSEAAAITQLALTTASVPLAANATAAAFQAAIGLASATVANNTGRLPTWLAMGPDAWGRLVAMTDTAGRPLFPALGPSNALGTGGADQWVTSVSGLRVVVTYGITDFTMYVGNEFGLEVYERKLPVLQAMEPSVFGRQISVQTALAFYRPVTAEATATPTPEENNGVVEIAWAA